MKVPPWSLRRTMISHFLDMWSPFLSQFLIRGEHLWGQSVENEASLQHWPPRLCPAGVAPSPRTPWELTVSVSQGCSVPSTCSSQWPTFLQVSECERRALSSSQGWADLTPAPTGYLTLDKSLTSPHLLNEVLELDTYDGSFQLPHSYYV